MKETHCMAIHLPHGVIFKPLADVKDMKTNVPPSQGAREDTFFKKRVCRKAFGKIQPFAASYPSPFIASKWAFVNA